VVIITDSFPNFNKNLVLDKESNHDEQELKASSKLLLEALRRVLEDKF
jgi:hypothetical protein